MTYDIYDTFTPYFALPETVLLLCDTGSIARQNEDRYGEWFRTEMATDTTGSSSTCFLPPFQEAPTPLYRSSAITEVYTDIAR